MDYGRPANLEPGRLERAGHHPYPPGLLAICLPGDITRPGLGIRRNIQKLTFFNSLNYNLLYFSSIAVPVLTIDTDKQILVFRGS